MLDAYIVGAVRTAGGRKNGRLSKVHPIDLGAEVVDALVERTGVAVDEVDDVIFGCVSQVGAQSSNIARNVCISSVLGEGVPGTTVDRQCGSGQQAMHFAAQAVLSGTQDLVIAGGVESMSQVPIGANIVDGYKMEHGLPYGKKISERYPGVQFNQFAGAEMLAKKYELTSDELNEFALDSHVKAKRAVEEGRFDREIVAVEVELEDGSLEQHITDEGIRMDATLGAIAGLEPMQEGGVLTAANASQICDGGSAVMIANGATCKRLGLKPMARIVAMSVIGSDPVIMLEGPIPATEKVLERAGMTLEDIDLFEVNEAFGSVPLSWVKALGADIDKLNVNGGAQALGHPLGGTGAKLMTTLVHELHRTGKRYGLLAICEGGGTANGTIVERVDEVA
ncbi:acetyl-CoA C-acetyltransferase [Candidatus Marimicrobium litorale]|jgi:acetyl-CoA C-acetyltransferase|uniref:Acetyl-CoA C-acyltransferase n=1 Tax=Candidatus Marimicrobium litorale TaxID=2518991 RepID=A0ABT3T1X3_9GAMM|nr:acetyl-CoA C-acetyltransferase [Candidatus Marimicrobium litorale]MCX2976273.1 acetyl-CoA C-acyltransferase [Candidatus Marimicrobium litorale]